MTEKINGLTFVFVGHYVMFPEKEVFKSFIESKGGRVTGATSGKTSYVITNTPDSTVRNILTAKKLGTPIISEVDFLKMFKNELMDSIYKHEKETMKVEDDKVFLGLYRSGEKVERYRAYERKQREKRSNTRDLEVAPIEWMIVKRDGDKALIVSKYVIDLHMYNDIDFGESDYNEKLDNTTWENCTLRKWLNEDFYKTVFSDEEKSIILESMVKADKNPESSANPGNDTKDRVFILSASEFDEYLSSDRMKRAAVTEYVISKQMGYSYYDDFIFSTYYFRTPGNDNSCAATVDRYDGIGIDNWGQMVSSEDGIRPAMWIDMSKLK